MRNGLAVKVSCLVLITTLGACSGPQEPPPPDVRALIRTNRFDEAVIEAERIANQDRNVQTLAVLATARAAQSTMAGGTTDGAVDTLNQAMAIGTRGEVIAAFAEEVTGSMAFDGGRLGVVAQVIASLAQGWEGGGDASDISLGAAACLDLAAYGSEHQSPEDIVSLMVRTAVALLENNTNDLVFPDHELHTAWVCFRSAGTIAGSTSGQTGALAAELALRIAESNPQLSIAVACDLSSPRDRLREALMRAHDADSLARFSLIMESSEGCSPGTYAP